ncbi:MAG: transposase [Nitrososphaeraceae archaeon]
MYDFYDRSNSTNTIHHLDNLRYAIKNNGWKRITLVWDNVLYHISKITREYVNAQHKKEKEDWFIIIHLPKRAPYLNPNERKVNQKIKSDICANGFYNNIEEQKDAI